MGNACAGGPANAIYPEEQAAARASSRFKQQDPSSQTVNAAGNTSSPSSRPSAPHTPQAAVDSPRPDPVAEEEPSSEGFRGATAAIARHEPAAAPADVRRFVLIVWDIENVRLPNHIPAKRVLTALKQHFIHDEGKLEYRTVAAVTERSLPMIQHRHPTFVQDVVANMALLLASAGHQKRNADPALIKELNTFVMLFSMRAMASPGQYTIVLLSEDEDFLNPIQMAIGSGFDVRLVTNVPATDRHRQQRLPMYSQNYSRPPYKWDELLCKLLGEAHVDLPYEDEQLPALALPGSASGSGGGLPAVQHQHHPQQHNAHHGAIRGRTVVVEDMPNWHWTTLKSQVAQFGDCHVDVFEPGQGIVRFNKEGAAGNAAKAAQHLNGKVIDGRRLRAYVTP